MSIELLKCQRCGYEWYPRTPESPKYCANKKCRSPYWNKPKVKQSGPRRNGVKNMDEPNGSYADYLLDLMSTCEPKPEALKSAEEVLDELDIYNTEPHPTLTEVMEEAEKRNRNKGKQSHD